MAGVDELSGQIEALKGEIEQTAASAGASMSSAEELSNQTQALGMESKAAEAMAVKDALEQLQNGLQALGEQAEGVRAQVEAMRTLRGGTGGGVSEGGGQENAPTPAGASRRGRGPNELPTGGPPAAAGEGDPESGRPAVTTDGFSVWLPGDAEYDNLRNDIGDPLQPLDEIDPSEDSGISRARRFGRGFIRGGGDIKSYGSDLAKSTQSVHSGMDLPDPADYDAVTIKQDVPTVQQPTPPPGPAADDIVGNTVLMSAVFFEAGTRLYDRIRGRR